MMHFFCCRARAFLTTTPAPETLTPQYEEQSFPDLPNIYFDYMREARIYHQHWKVIVYFDVRDLYQTATHIDSLLLWASTGKDKNSKMIWESHNLRYALWKTYAQNVVASTGLSLEDSPLNVSPREKRGLFNFVGTIAKSLFGTMSADDADYYNTAIDSVITTNNKLARLVKNETHILQTNIIDANYIQNVTLSHITSIQDQITNFTLNTEHFLKLGLLISMFADSILIFESMIMHAEISQLHPNLFTPSQLKTIVQDISLKYGQNQLVKGLSELNYHHLFLTSNVNAVVLKSHKICFEIRVPILEQTVFSAIHLVPLPLIQKHYSHFVALDSQYIFLDLSTRNYMPTTLQEISKCRKADNILYCERHVPKFSLSMQDPCLKVATRSHLGESHETCSMGIARINHTVWIQLQSPNSWIGIFPSCEYGQLNCPNDFHKTLTLCQVFRISLMGGCTLTTPSATLLSSFDAGKMEFNTTLGLPKFSTEFINTDFFTNIPEIKKSHINADEIHDTIRTLDSISYEAEQLESQYRIHRNSYSSRDTVKTTLISLTVSLVIILCIPCTNYFSHCMVTNTVASEQIFFNNSDHEPVSNLPLTQEAPRIPHSPLQPLLHPAPHPHPHPTTRTRFSSLAP